MKAWTANADEGILAAKQLFLQIQGIETTADEGTSLHLKLVIQLKLAALSMYYTGFCWHEERQSDGVIEVCAKVLESWCDQAMYDRARFPHKDALRSYSAKLWEVKA